jgi:S1-C subfamily serine protease
MKRHHIYALIIGFLFLFYGLTQYLTPSDSTLRKATVKVIHTEAGGHGTGFLLDRHTVITASHVINATGAPAKELDIQLKGGLVKAEVVSFGIGDYDVAVLRLKEPAPRPYRTLSLRCTAPSQGDKVKMVGFPMAAPLVIVHGTVATDANYPNRGKNLLVQGPVIGGMSGGPVVNESGEVVGLVTAYMIMPIFAGFMPVPSTTGLSFILTGDHICNALARS